MVLYYYLKIKGASKIKVIMMLADGMRPDALAEIPVAQEIMKKSACTAFYVVALVNIGAATKITGSEAAVCALYN